ncbi:MAG TPA: metallophosphoesterase family protein [Treponemataceae bacterium]|nr:metallophosphoesterase family protein [Treponemataceae bacterium]
MKMLVLSDIHANFPALTAILEQEPVFSGLLCLGDITGYGSDPQECVSKIQSLIRDLEYSLVLCGNHDALLSNRIARSWFNPHALKTLPETRNSLNSESIEWLSSLPASKAISPAVYASHGSPLASLTGYLWGGFETMSAFSWMEKRDISICFTGHTHEAACFIEGIPVSIINPEPGFIIKLDGKRKIINPGSVGFPRSFNGLYSIPELKSWPAYYALWNTSENSVTFKSAQYDRRDFEMHLEK